GPKPSTPEHVAPPLSGAAEGAESGEAVSSGSGSPEHEPEMVHTGRTLALSLDAARERYEKKGTKCGGAEAPDQGIGKPDQRNEMQVGRSKMVVFGFRYAEGTLIIRCKNDHVESTKALKK